MSNSYINDIISAIRSAEPSTAALDITPEMHFYDIPEMDSMSIINVQIELGALIGEKAKTVQPIMDMTIAEYAEVLESI